MKKIIIYTIVLMHSLCINIFAADNADTTRNPFVRIAATKHNQNIELLRQSSHDVHNHIFTQYVINPIRPIEKSIKDILSLSTTCTHFNNMLPYFGKLLQSYNFDLRKKTMKAVRKKIDDYTYQKYRRSMLLLAHAGYNRIASRFVYENDYEILKALFANGADANKYYSLLSHPIFFDINTPLIAQLFIDHGANLQLRERDLTQESLLEYYIRTKRPFPRELIMTYIHNGYNPRETYKNGNNILHQIALSCTDRSIKEDIIFFLELIPDMINAVNKFGRTPLDCCDPKQEDVVGLFKKHGAKRSQELSEEKSAQALKPIEDNKEIASCCIICFEDKNLTVIPCGKNHVDQVCVTCIKPLKNCPLCRAAINNNK